MLESPAARWSQAVMLVVLWMALGKALDLGANAYLVLGIPLTVVFQVGIRRRPLTELWFRVEGTGPTLHGWLVLVLVLWPGLLCLAGLSKGQFVVALYGLASVVGAVGCAGAMAVLGRRGWRDVALCLATAGVVGVGIVALASSIAPAARVSTSRVPPLAVGVLSLATYLPAVFVMEEVVFRGLIDTHVHPGGSARGIPSAVAVSAMWGLWHLPLVRPSWTNVGELLVVHVAVGVPLSLFWRRSRNLAVPGIAHAVIDAVRNVVLS